MDRINMMFQDLHVNLENILLILSKVLLEENRIC